MKQSEVSAWDYLWYALYAFAGLGLELLLIGMIEPKLFGNISTSDYSVSQNIIHWILTMVYWGVICAFLIHSSDKKFSFNVLSNERPKKQGFLITGVLIIACIVLNAFAWQTLKIVGEFQKKELILFVFQYFYYMFEIGLVFLIVAFGQKFAEELLKKKTNIPFGGIVLCCTWGVIHILSKGSIITGLGVMVFASLYGLMYIFLNRNAKYSYLAMLLAFII